MKIIVSGPAAASDGETGELILDPERLRSLDGLRYDADVCANHLFHELLNDVSIVGGAVQLAFDAQRGRLRVVSEYWTPAPLRPDQLAALAEQTLGSWSDGIGEGCFDEWSSENGIDLDLAPFASDDYEHPVAEQVDDGQEVPRYAHLAKAVWNGNRTLVEQAIADKADLDAIYDGFTALHLAIQKQDVPTALLLITGGADLNRLSPLGTTPLTACASLKQEADAIAVARTLLENGADPKVPDENGKTALAVARDRKYIDLVALLSSYQAR